MKEGLTYKAKWKKTALALLLTAFAGIAVSCGKQEPKEESEAVFDSKKAVLISDENSVAVGEFFYIPLEGPIGLNYDSTSYLHALNDEWLYYNGYGDRYDESGEYYSVTWINRIRIKDGFLEKGYIDNNIPIKKSHIHALLVDGGGNCYTFLRPGLWIAESGEIVVSDAGYSMEKYDENGELQWHRDYTEEEMQGLAESLQKGTVTEDGRVFLYTYGAGGKVFCFGQDGNLEDVYTPAVKSLDGIAAGKNGKVYGYCLTEGTPVFAEVGGTGENYTCSIKPLQLYNGYVNGVLLRDGEGLWALEPENGELRQLWRWSEDYIQIDGDNMDSCYPGDGTLMILLSEQGNYGLERNSKPVATFASIGFESADEYPGKQEITLATVKDQQSQKDDRLYLLVNWYNRDSREYKVRIVQEKDLEMKFIKGECEDLIELTNMYAGHLAKNGAFEDLTPYYEASGIVSGEDILEAAAEASRIRGKNVSVIPSFRIMTMRGREAVDSEDWDVRKFLEMGRENLMFAEQNPMYALTFCMGIKYGEHFIDYENKECHFDSEEFRRILEGCAGWPEYGLFQEGLSYSTNFEDGDWFFDTVSIRSAWDIFYEDDEKYIEKLIGYPGWEGPEYRFYPDNVFAINSTSKNKEGAWDFLEYLMSDRLQERIDWGFPSRKDSFEAYVNEIYVPFNNKYVITPGEKEFAAIRKMVEASVYDSEVEVLNPVWEIVTEEAGMYFAGDATLEDTVSKIQNRVQLYLDEN